MARVRPLSFQASVDQLKKEGERASESIHILCFVHSSLASLWCAGLKPLSFVFNFKMSLSKPRIKWTVLLVPRDDQFDSLVLVKRLQNKRPASEPWGLGVPGPREPQQTLLAPLGPLAQARACGHRNEVTNRKRWLLSAPI